MGLMFMKLVFVSFKTQREVAVCEFLKVCVCVWFLLDLSKRRKFLWAVLSRKVKTEMHHLLLS